MLQELVIHDFAIIDQLELSFASGMTALTGETGAGKSIIIDAVGLLAGGRGSADFVRTGAAKATLEGLFTAPADSATATVLATYGLTSDDDTVLLQRDIYASGRNLCRVNGRLVNTATLREVGETLVDIHGQNEHQQLMHPETHLGLLDQFGGPSLAKRVAQYRHDYAAYEKAAAALRKKQANEQEWAQRLDMLQFQVEEIADAKLQPDEEDQLTAERDRLANFQRISDALNQSYAVLTDDAASPVDALGTVMSSLQGVADYDPAYAALAEQVAGAYYALQDVQSDLSHQVAALEFDEGRLDEVESRLELLTQLKRKYGDSVAAVIAYGEKAARELADMQATEAGASGLEASVAQQAAALTKEAAALTKARRAAATTLTKAIHAQLAALYMAKTVFTVRFTPKHDFGPDGADTVEFYIQTNPGEAAKPLAKIASGGELSRLMLALKTIFAKSAGVTSIIFDEVDTGVSGRVAQAIATKISTIALSEQVLCITHLPQVAAMSDHEYLIAKTVSHGRTRTTVTPLSATERVAELARMTAGETITDLAKQHAQELLAQADTIKAKLRAGH